MPTHNLGQGMYKISPVTHKNGTGLMGILVSPTRDNPSRAPQPNYPTVGDAMDTIFEHDSWIGSGPAETSFSSVYAKGLKPEPEPLTNKDAYEVFGAEKIGEMLRIHTIQTESNLFPKRPWGEISKKASELEKVARGGMASISGNIEAYLLLEGLLKDKIFFYPNSKIN